ncbi:MAG: Ig-like domain-containing protein, partial [Ignavibacteriaceae bacterium]
NLPSFGTFTDNGDGTGLISFLPGFGEAGSYPGIQVVATDDGTPVLTDTTTFTLTVGDVNRAPVVDPIAAQNMNEGDSLGVAVSSTDADGDSLNLVILNLPSFGSFTDNGDGTGLISFLPGFGDASTYPNIQVIATDNGTPNLSDTTTFTLTVGDVNRAPVVDPIAAQNMNEGDSLGVAVSSTDADGDSLNLVILNMPSFASFRDNGDGTGLISFLPDFGDAGSYPNILVIATDDGTPVLSDTTTFTLAVGDVNRAPVLRPIIVHNMNEGDSLDVLARATDADGDNIVLTALNLPSFASFTDNGDGTGEFLLLPGPGDSGSYPGITAIATDNGNPSLTDTARFDLTVGIEAIADPTDLNITALIVDHVELNWTDNSDNEDGFIIERQDTDTTAFLVIDTVFANTVGYTDTTGLQGKKYNYQVKGFNLYTESGYTGPIEVITILPAPSELLGLISGSPKVIQLNWVDNSRDELGFAIERDSAGTGFVIYDTVGTNITSYIDSLVVSDTTYIYKVFAYTADAISEKSDTVQLVIPTDVTENLDLTPDEYDLYQNYPNPFNPSTRIRFALPSESKVKLELYNALGELVRVLIDNEIMEVGFQEVEFNAANYPSGVYFYRIIAVNNANAGRIDFVKTKKMILLK